MAVAAAPAAFGSTKSARFFNLIWDEADALQRLARTSHPRVTVDTSGLSPEATKLANELAQRIRKLPMEKVEALKEG